jgi:hypothetical protein
VSYRFVFQSPALGGRLHLLQRGFQPREEAFVHRLFFLLPIGTAGQDERFVAFGAGNQFHFHPRLDFVPVPLRQILLEAAQHGLGRADDIRPAPGTQELQVRFADHPAVQHPDTLCLPVFPLHGTDDPLDRRGIVGVAGEDFVAQGDTVIRHHQPNAHLRAVRAVVSGITPPGQRVADAFPFKVRAGDVVEQQVVLQIE